MDLFTAPLSAEANGLPVLIMGISSLGEALCVNDEGQFLFYKLPELTVNWRYDWEDHAWVDVGELDDTQDDPLDGGPEFQGSVPEPDGIGSGDPLNEEGR